MNILGSFGCKTYIDSDTCRITKVRKTVQASKGDSGFDNAQATLIDADNLTIAQLLMLF